MEISLDTLLHTLDRLEVYSTSTYVTFIGLVVTWLGLRRTVQPAPVDSGMPASQHVAGTSPKRVNPIPWVLIIGLLIIAVAQGVSIANTHIDRRMPASVAFQHLKDNA